MEQPTCWCCDLAALPPGPGPAAALAAIELGGVPNDRMLDVLAAQYRQLSHEQARTAAVLAELGRCSGYPAPGQVDRLDAPERYAAEEARAALRWTRRAAEWEHELADTVVHTMPELHTAWLAGAVDRPRVMVFDRFLVGCTPEQVTAICRTAVPRAPRLTTGQLAVLLRRMVLAVDPAAAERWYRKRGPRTQRHRGDGSRRHRHPQRPRATRRRGRGRVRPGAGPGRSRETRRAPRPDRADQMRPVPRPVRRPIPRDGHRAGHHHPDRAVPPRPPRLRTRPTRRDPGRRRRWRPDVPPHADRSSTGGGRPGGTGTGSTAAGAGTGGAGPDPAPPCGPRTAAPGPARRGAALVGIEVRVALSTLLGHDESSGEIPGLGLLSAPDTRARVALQRRAQWRFAVTDDNGRLLSEGITRRRPTMVGEHPVRHDGPPGGIVEIHIPVGLLHELATAGADDWAGVIADIAAQHARRHAHLADLDARPDDRFPRAALRRHTEIRDRTCIFPGCRRRAHTAEQDHTRDKAHGGPTSTANTAPACDHDHDVKHRGGWRLSQPEPGQFVWHSPLGGEYRTYGEFLLPELPDPIPVDLGEHFDQPTHTVDGPILRPYRPVQRPRPPPPAREMPDEAPF